MAEEAPAAGRARRAVLGQLQPGTGREEVRQPAEAEQVGGLPRGRAEFAGVRHQLGGQVAGGSTDHDDVTRHRRVLQVDEPEVAAGQEHHVVRREVAEDVAEVVDGPQRVDEAPQDRQDLGGPVPEAVVPERPGVPFGPAPQRRPGHAFLDEERVPALLEEVDHGRDDPAGRQGLQPGPFRRQPVTRVPAAEIGRGVRPAFLDHYFGAALGVLSDVHAAPVGVSHRLTDHETAVQHHGGPLRCPGGTVRRAGAGGRGEG
ncbi:hypothetical protein GCM10018952_56100 [Streptosporangium vulgare]